MQTFSECLPCLMKQAKEAPRRFTDDPAMLESIVRQMEKLISDSDLNVSPPVLGGALNRIIAETLGVDDPYIQEKRHFNQLALTLMDSLRKTRDESKSPFETAIRLVAGANVMDFGAPEGLKSGGLEAPFQRALEIPIFGAELLPELENRLMSASKILYIADNAGEIVVDRLLIELLPRGSVTVAVRSGPAINDALLEDARFAGLDQVATVIESGAALPGTPLSEVSDAFLALFKEADVIISKGQGNFETLSHEKGPIYFLLTAKCSVVANILNCQTGDLVLHRLF